MKRRRTVTLVVDANHKPRAGTSLWGYDLRALARLIGMSIDTVIRDIEAEKLDPADLWSVIAWVKVRQSRQAARVARRRHRAGIAERRAAREARKAAKAERRAARLAKRPQ